MKQSKRKTDGEVWGFNREWYVVEVCEKDKLEFYGSAELGSMTPNSWAKEIRIVKKKKQL